MIQFFAHERKYQKVTPDEKYNNNGDASRHAESLQISLPEKSDGAHRAYRYQD
jgi:hypothetical protein